MYFQVYVSIFQNYTRINLKLINSIHVCFFFGMQVKCLTYSNCLLLFSIKNIMNITNVY